MIRKASSNRQLDSHSAHHPLARHQRQPPRSPACLLPRDLRDYHCSFVKHLHGPPCSPIPPLAMTCAQPCVSATAGTCLWRRRLCPRRTR